MGASGLRPRRPGVGDTFLLDQVAEAVDCSSKTSCGCGLQPRSDGIEGMARHRAGHARHRPCRHGLFPVSPPFLDHHTKVGREKNQKKGPPARDDPTSAAAPLLTAWLRPQPWWRELKVHRFPKQQLALWRGFPRKPSRLAVASSSHSQEAPCPSYSHL